MVLLLVAQAFGWSHRGHVWDEQELPLRVCAARPLDAATDRAIDLWNPEDAPPWLVRSCEDAHVYVGFDDDEPGAIAAFTLQPTEVGPESTPCAYTQVFSGRADVRFSGDIDWTQPVGTAAGSCAPDDLQVRLLARYLGITLGLDSSPDSDVMGPFEDCAPPVVTASDHDGLLALYGFPASCAPSATPPPEGSETAADPASGTAARGCSTQPFPVVAGWLAGFALLGRRRSPQNKPS